ncbi:MAG: 4a-hydroxytetrahydrobiopterin dehydratase [Fimbriimonas sp.]|nr:4a-hydroxytetrahydrobiopterin dehydratase [Fimbriimonas sp.]
MAELEYRKLTGDEVAAELTALTGWAVENEKLSKRFSFNTYKDGLVFALAVGQVADQMNHHPDLEVGYARVHVSVYTHAVNGLSPFDFELARRIEILLA